MSEEVGLGDWCHSLEAERGLLASALRASADVLPEITAVVKPDWFHFPGTRLIWDAILEFQAASKPLDVLLLQEHFIRGGTLEKIGGPATILELLDLVPTGNHWFFYAETLQDRWGRRRMGDASATLQDGAKDLGTPWKESIEKAEGLLFDLRTGDGGAGAQPMSDAVNEVLEHLQTVWENRGKPVFGVPCGFPDIDRCILGFEDGEMLIIGSRPSMGKTSMMGSIIERMAVDPPRESFYCGTGEHRGEPKITPLQVFSLEMPVRQILTRCVVGYAGALQRAEQGDSAELDLSKSRTGMFSEEDWTYLHRAAAKYHAAPVYWEEPADHSISEIKARIRLAHRKYGVKAVLIDYLQLIKPVTKLGQSEERLGISEVCYGLKAVAKQLGIVIILLAQTNRGSEENPGKIPTLRDFDGGSGIEKAADYAGFIHRPEKYKPWSRLNDNEKEEWLPTPTSEPNAYERERIGEERYKQHALFVLQKNRHGGEATLPLRFIGPLARFEPVTLRAYSNNQTQRQH